MSHIGAVSSPVLSLASSVAGGQQAKPELNQQRADAARQDFKNTLLGLSVKSSQDVDDTQLHSDRDADGRATPEFTEDAATENLPLTTDSHPSSAKFGVHKVADAEGNLGQLFDFDA